MFASVTTGRAATYIVVALIGAGMLRWNRTLAVWILQTNTDVLDGVRGRRPGTLGPHGLSTLPLVVLVVRAILVLFGVVFFFGCLADLVFGVR
jgi:hypothetical protein